MHKKKMFIQQLSKMFGVDMEAELKRDSAIALDIESARVNKSHLILNLGTKV